MCPVLPDHKPWLVVQGRAGEFFIDHAHPFGASCASSNAGMIGNAIVDIWISEGVAPLLKYEDDLNCFRFPVHDGPFLDNGLRYAYDRASMLSRISSLNVPWHPDKGDLVFSSTTTFLGLLWDLENHHVSLPEHKRLKFFNRVLIFITTFNRTPNRCLLKDVEKIHGSLCYIAFVHPEGRSRLPSLSNFAASFHADEFTRRFPPPSVITDLKWWLDTLSTPGVFRQLIPRGPPLDIGIFVDASTSWGIGIIVEGRWLAFELAPAWKEPGKDICWLETLAVEFLVYILEVLGISNQRVLIHSDNQGTIGAMDKGRSGNCHINLSIRRTYTVLSSLMLMPDFIYVPSIDNPADPLSRGELGPQESRLAFNLKLPAELRRFFI